MIEWTIASVLVLGAPALKEKPPEPPIGEWDLVQMVLMGGPPIKPKGPDDTIRSMRLRFTSTSRTVTSPRSQRQSTVRVTFFRVDTTLQLDVSPDDPDNVERGIWKLEGHTLTICQGLPGEPRPTEFTCPRGSNRVLVVLKRVKSE